jgi:hypothetical protein
MTISYPERKLAVLRHMEKVRGEFRDGRQLIRLWDWRLRARIEVYPSDDQLLG